MDASGGEGVGVGVGGALEQNSHSRNDTGMDSAPDMLCPMDPCQSRLGTEPGQAKFVSGLSFGNLLFHFIVTLL